MIRTATLVSVLFVALPALAQFTGGPKKLESSRTESGTYENAIRGMSLKAPSLSAVPIEVFEEDDRNDPTATVYFLDPNGWLLGAIYTRIRPDYPKDFTLIESKIKPMQDEQQTRWGSDTYTVAIEQVEGTPVLVTRNRRPSFSGESDLQFLRHTSGDHDESNECKCARVDFHFVRGGYYVQIVSIAKTRVGLTPSDALEKARVEGLEAFKNLIFRP